MSGGGGTRPSRSGHARPVSGHYPGNVKNLYLEKEAVVRVLVPLGTLETLLVPEQEGLLLGFGSWFSGHQERDLLETVPAALADWTQVPADTVDKPVEIETCGSLYTQEALFWPHSCRIASRQPQTVYRWQRLVPKLVPGG